MGRESLALRLRNAAESVRAESSVCRHLSGARPSEQGRPIDARCGKLQNENLITYRRIVVLNRLGLEQLASECYRTIRRRTFSTAQSAIAAKRNERRGPISNKRPAKAGAGFAGSPRPHRVAGPPSRRAKRAIVDRSAFCHCPS
jgi:hypothetical protein